MQLETIDLSDILVPYKFTIKLDLVRDIRENLSNSPLEDS